MFEFVDILWTLCLRLQSRWFFGYAIIVFFKSSTGWFGEKAVVSTLKKLDKANYFVLNDV